MCPVGNELQTPMFHMSCVTLHGKYMVSTYVQYAVVCIVWVVSYFVLSHREILLKTLIHSLCTDIVKNSTNTLKAVYATWGTVRVLFSISLILNLQWCKTYTMVFVKQVTLSTCSFSTFSIAYMCILRWLVVLCDVILFDDSSFVFSSVTLWCF